MEKVCRGCLNQFNDISDFKKYSEKNRRMFVYCTDIQVKRNDFFTFQLCTECYSHMKAACNFKKSCRNSDKKQKSYISGKETGDIINEDFFAFLDNCDNSTNLRLPHMIQPGTHPYKTKDDGNVSTTTSIRNFMKDMVGVDEIPDSEARIINEVIQEEADISDDSLDSHWLEDVSFGSDMRLDLCLSPFSTTRSILNDHCYSIPPNYNQYEVTQNNNHDININCKQNIEELVQETGDQQNNTCIIDKNLQRALDEEDIQNFSLDALLATPPMIQNAWAPSTPTIRNILFGERLDNDIHESGQCIEAYEDVRGTTNIEEFKQHGSNHNINDINIGDEIQSKDIEETLNQFLEQSNQINDKHDKVEQIICINENNDNVDQNKCVKANEICNGDEELPSKKIYSLKRKRCKKCKRKFKGVGSLKHHLTTVHKIKLKSKPYKRKSKVMVCDYCGKTFAGKNTFVKHIEHHLNPVEFKCLRCPLTFSTEARLRMHQSTHNGFITKKPSEKKYECHECGSTFTTSSNFAVHLKRHTKQFTHKCHCGAGFYRNSELIIHTRKHTGERPYACVYCPSKFTRHDALNKHIKGHTGEKPHQCQFCLKRFSTLSVMKIHQTHAPICLEKQHKMAFPDSMNFPTR